MSDPEAWWYGRPRLTAGWARGCARLATWLGSVAAGAAGIAAALIAALAVLTVALVVLRYCFGWNHTGLEELKWHLFGTAVMLAGAWCLARDGHVRMDLIYSRLPPRARAAVDCLGLALIVLPLCALVVWYGSAMTIDSFERGELSRDAGGLSHRFAIRAMVPLGFALLGLQGLAQLLRSLVVVLGGPRPAAAIDRADDEAAM